MSASSTERPDLQTIALALQGLSRDYVSGIPLSLFKAPEIHEDDAVSEEAEQRTPLLIITDAGSQRQWRAGADGALLEAALEKGLKRGAPDVEILHIPDRAQVRVQDILEKQPRIVLVLGDRLWYRLAVSAPKLFGMPFKDVFGQVHTIDDVRILSSYSPQECNDDGQKKREFWTHLKLLMQQLNWR